MRSQADLIPSKEYHAMVSLCISGRRLALRLHSTGSDHDKQAWRDVDTVFNRHELSFNDRSHQGL